MWTTAKTTSQPGLQVSVFPEFLDDAWADWDVSSTAVEISHGIKTFATLSSFEAPSAPAACTAIVDGAVSMAAASVVAVAAVASTML